MSSHKREGLHCAENVLFSSSEFAAKKQCAADEVMAWNIPGTSTKIPRVKRPKPRSYDPGTDSICMY